MKVKYKFLIFVLSFMLVVATATIVETSDDLLKSVSAGYADESVVIIDAGHGNFDGGAVAVDGTVEKNLNLSIALQLKEICRTNGLQVYMVREDDSSLEDNSSASIRKRKNSDLLNRVKLMEKFENSIYVSVHMNKFSDSKVHGAQIFYSPNFEESKELADSLRSYVNLFDESNTKSIKKGTKDAYILYNAKCPSVIFECGFMSNPNELEKLKDFDYQRKISFSIYLGIIDYFNIKEK